MNEIQNPNKNLKTRKTVAGILLLIILLSSVSLYPRKAEAVWPVVDWVAIGTTIVEYSKKAGETVLDIATSAFRKMILDMIVDEIIAWISGEGTSAFDTGDWGQFFDEAAQQAGGVALEEITGPGVMTQLCDADWAGQVRFSLQPPKKFAQKSRCTLRDIGVNFDDFIENFENGGWAAWIKISEGSSNPYTYFLSAVDEKLAKETQKKLGLEKELTASGGFLGIKNCVQISCISGIKSSGELEYEKETGKWKENEVPKNKGDIGTLVRACTCEKWETETPGKTMADSLSKTIFKDVDWLQNNPEWYNYVVAIGNAVVNRLTKEGVKAIKSSVPKGSSTSEGITKQTDYTAPLTSAKIINPWRVKLTANEPAKIYYSLDGSNPSTYRSFEYKGDSLTIVNSTVFNAPTAQLKWMGVDDNFNKENTRSLPAVLRAPFNKTSLTAYIASQDVSIPDEIQKALIKFFRDEENGKNVAKISEETSIPADLRLNLKNYLKIEDLRIQTGRITMLSAEQRGQLDAILATYDDFNPANDGKLTDLINILTAIKNSGTDAFADTQTNAEEIKNRRDNLQSVLSYLNGLISGLEACSKKQAEAVIKEGETNEEFAIRTAVEFASCQATAQAGAFPVNLAGLSSALAIDPLFSELKDKTDKVILERSLIAIDPAANLTFPAATLAPADSERAVLLSVNPLTEKPTAIFFKQITWDDKLNARNLAFNQASNNNINGFYFKQAFAIPPEGSGTHIWYGAIDAANNPTEEVASGDFGAPVDAFANLPPIVDLVNPIAEIKTPVKDNAGYFVLNPFSSVDNDNTSQISGYEWDFINETSATATPRYDFEIFDLNRDNVFETTQCLYNFYAGNKIITGKKEENRYYVKGGDEVHSTTVEQKYYDAAHSSPYNKAPNVKELNLDLPQTCLKMESSGMAYYKNIYKNGVLFSRDSITESTFNQHSSAEKQGEKFNIGLGNNVITAPNDYNTISKEKISLDTGAYEDMIVDPNYGIIKVKFAAGGGPITVNLRVTDDEGLTDVESVVIYP